MGKEIADWIKQTRQLNRMTQTDLAKYLGISLGAVYKYESNKMVPGASIYQKLQQLENKTSKDSGPEEKEDTSMHEFAMQLAKEKIESQANKILALEKKLINIPKGSYPLWNDILYDFKTKQQYSDSSCTSFKTYDMENYQDFYQRLGYTRSEAEKYWTINHRMMTNRGNMSTEEQRAFLQDGKAMPMLINFEKTDNKVSSVEACVAHFEYAMKYNIASQLQVYNTCYYRKDGSELLAVLSVLYNFTDMTSTTKIKFINT